MEKKRKEEVFLHRFSDDQRSGVRFCCCCCCCCCFCLLRDTVWLRAFKYAFKDSTVNFANWLSPPSIVKTICTGRKKRRNGHRSIKVKGVKKPAWTAQQHLLLTAQGVSEENVPLLDRFWTGNKLTELNTSGGQENALLKQANFLFPLHLQNQIPYRRTGATLDLGHVRTPHLAIRGSYVPHISRFEGMCTLTSLFYKGMASKVIQGNFYVEIFIVCVSGCWCHFALKQNVCTKAAENMKGNGESHNPTIRAPVSFKPRP